MNNKFTLINFKTTELCNYGCGQIAKYQSKSGKYYCSEYWQGCPAKRKLLSKAQKEKQQTTIPINTTELCSYGCGQIAKYKFKNGNICCSESKNSCPVHRKQLSESGKGKIIPKAIPIETTELCGFGCGQIAKYKLKHGKLCCSNHINKCPINRKKISNTKKGKLKPKTKFIKTTELCSYGCGLIAKYQFNNGKLCCHKHINKCPENIKKLSKHQKGLPIETTKLCDFGCGQIARYEFNNGKLCCSKHSSQCPFKIKNQKLTISQIKENNSTFAKVEEMRYNPDKPNEKEIQVRCKNHDCPNSKEHDGWFTPTTNQFHERIYCLERPWGNDGGFFYCSEKCKGDCKLFNVHGDPFKEIKSLPYTPGELNTWKQEVLKRQRIEHKTEFNFCEKCYSTENLQIHHYKPVKLYPGLSLDPDNGHILCKKCHYKYGHETGTECSTGNLANANPCD